MDLLSRGLSVGISSGRGSAKIGPNYQTPSDKFSVVRVL